MGKDMQYRSTAGNGTRVVVITACGMHPGNYVATFARILPIPLICPCQTSVSQCVVTECSGCCLQLLKLKNTTWPCRINQVFLLKYSPDIFTMQTEMLYQTVRVRQTNPCSVKHSKIQLIYFRFLFWLEFWLVHGNAWHHLYPTKPFSLQTAGKITDKQINKSVMWNNQNSSNCGKKVAHSRVVGPHRQKLEADQIFSLLFGCEQ